MLRVSDSIYKVENIRKTASEPILKIDDDPVQSEFSQSCRKE